MLSERTLTAVNDLVRPFATVGEEGLTTMAVRTAGVTVRVVVPMTLPKVAVIEVDPTASAEAVPCDPNELEIVAVKGFDDAQTTRVERSLDEPSVNVPVATYCTACPLANDELDGVTAIVSRAAGSTVKVVEPVTPPRPP